MTALPNQALWQCIRHDTVNVHVDTESTINFAFDR